VPLWIGEEVQALLRWYDRTVSDDVLSKRSTFLKPGNEAQWSHVLAAILVTVSQELPRDLRGMTSPR